MCSVSCVPLLMPPSSPANFPTNNTLYSPQSPDVLNRRNWKPDEMSDLHPKQVSLLRYVINNRSRKDPYLGSRPPSLIHLTWPLSSSFLMNGFDNFLIIKASGPSQTWIFNAFH